MFFSAVSIAKVFSVFLFFLITKFLEPSEYGLFLTLQLITMYTPIFCLGTMETLVKQYPFYIGKGLFEKARELENNVYASIVLASILVAIIGGIIIIVLSFRLKFLMLISIAAMTIISSSGFFFMFNHGRSMAHQNFKMTGFLEGFQSILMFITLVPLTYFFHFKGAIAGYFISNLAIQLISIYMATKKFGPLKFKIKKNELLKNIKIGLPISMIWWFWGIQQSIDRLISMSLLGKTMTGYYGLGTRIVSTLSLIPLSAGRVLYPKISEKLGGNCSREQLERIVVGPTRVLGIIICPMIGIVLTILPIFYELLFKEYTKGLQSVQILLIGFYFTCQVRNGLNYLIAINKQKLALAYMSSCLAICVIMELFFVKLKLGIDGIALGVSISSFYLTIVVWGTTLLQLGYTIKNVFFKLLSLNRPFVLFLLLPLILIWVYKKICAGQPIYYELIIYLIVVTTIIIISESSQKHLSEILVLINIKRNSQKLSV